MNSCVILWDSGTPIPSEAAGFAAVWLQFRCTGELSAYVLSRVMTHPAPLNCQSILARRKSRWYWVLLSEFETQLAWSWQSRSYCGHMINVNVHQRVLGTYCHDLHGVISNPILQSTQSTRLMSSHDTIWEMSSLIRGKATACAGLPSLFRNTADRHSRVSEPETWLGYSWRSCTFRCWVCPGLRFNFGRLGFSINVSFLLMHTSTATIRLQSTCTPLQSALYILVCFILIMFSSALNQ